MKVYFNASIRGLPELQDNYQNIAYKIKSMGHTLLDESFAGPITDTFYSGSELDRLQKYKDTIKYLKQAELVILEISIHSLTMGYLLRMALDLGKPVIALYCNDHLPLFASLIESDKLQVLDYSTRNLSDLLQAAITNASDLTGNRFNFFLPPFLAHYLDQVAHNRKIPRAVYLRHLIESDYEHHQDTYRLS